MSRTLSPPSQAKEVAEGAGKTPRSTSSQIRWGSPRNRFEQTIASLDLMVVCDEGARARFLDSLAKAS